MTSKTDSSSIDLSHAARTRVRLPQVTAPTRLFQGWGPTV